MTRRQTPQPTGLILGVRPIFLVALVLSTVIFLWIFGTVLLSARAASLN